MIHLSSIHHYTAPLATLAPLLLATVHFALFTPANLEHPHLSFSLRTIPAARARSCCAGTQDALAASRRAQCAPESAV